MTASKLDYLKERGFLYPSHANPLGYGYGTESLYVRGTAELVVALCDLRARTGERRIERLGWQLWLQRHPINPSLIRGILQRVADKRAARFGKRTGRGTDDAQWDDEGKERERDPVLSHFQGRLGPVDYPTFTDQFLRVLRGDFKKWEDERTEPYIVAKGFGLTGADLGGRGALISGLTTIMQVMNATFPGKQLSEGLRAASDTDLEQAREEVIEGFDAIKDMGGRLFPQANRSSDARPTARTFDSFTYGEQTWFLLCWLTLRGMPYVIQLHDTALDAIRSGKLGDQR
jgi:hypothetical protein